MGWTAIAWACRLVIGLVCVASALGKSLDLPGFVEVLITYRLFFPDWVLWSMAVAITGLEWVLGLWLLAGWRIQSGALLALIMYGLYAMGLVVTLFRGIALPNCGCYGVFFPQPLRWYSPLEDLVLVGMSYALWRSGKKTANPLTPISNGRRRTHAASHIWKSGRSDRPRGCHPGLSSTLCGKEG